MFAHKINVQQKTYTSGNVLLFEWIFIHILNFSDRVFALPDRCFKIFRVLKLDKTRNQSLLV